MTYPSQDEYIKLLEANMTSCQERCTELLLENRRLRATVEDLREKAADLKRMVKLP